MEKNTQILTLKKILDTIRNGTPCKVIGEDSDGNAEILFLEYNETRRKFYFRRTLDDVQRITINTREAKAAIIRTLVARQKYEI